MVSPAMEEGKAEHIANVLKALAHPVRLRIVEILRNGKKSVNEIAESIGGKQSITSQQLNMMKDRGVLSCRKDGARVYYKIENESVLELLECMEKGCQEHKKRRRG